MEAYVEHYKSGKRHPLCVEKESFIAFLGLLNDRGDLDGKGYLKAMRDGRIRINGILVLAFDIK